MIEYTKEQEEAIHYATKSVLSDKTYRIGGYAGTGKTTVAKEIISRIPHICMPCSFTGKAVQRMREKGVKASTIHSTIYDYDKETKMFYLKPYVEGHYFLVDEASMISSLLWRGLQKFSKPIILIGDPGQLEPIGDDPVLMRDADYVLNQIHRQAEGSGIIQFATDVRLKQKVKPAYLNVKFLTRRDLSKDLLLWADIIISGYNRTRCSINEIVRTYKDYKGILDVGETIMILRNNMWKGVFNGQLLQIKDVMISGSRIYVGAVDTLGVKFELCLLAEQFGKERPLDIDFLDKPNHDLILADYGYCVSCHKSQGSEWDKVLVIDEQNWGWDMVRWRYTAITRAAKELVYVGAGF